MSVLFTGRGDVPTQESKCLCFTANTAGSTISMSVTGTPTLGQNFSYSSDGETWTTFTPGTTTVTLSSAGDKAYFKGNNPNGVNESGSAYYKFTMTGSIAASGNIMSLIDNGACSTLIIPNNYCFCMMFQGCFNLTTPPALPATTLTKCCYQYMFKTSYITTAPALPAITLAYYCYHEMFANCGYLTAAPILPATTLAECCYLSMFYNCSKLTTVPALPATTLPTGCYDGMFEDCTELKVYNYSGTGYANAWTIPTSGTASGQTTQSDMFYGTTGNYNTQSSAILNRTFYTQNTPVS